jgi:PAS domain S-box-containing protein
MAMMSKIGIKNQVGSVMKPPGTKITTALWLSFGTVLIILGVTLLVYGWQFRQTSDRAAVVYSMEARGQAALEMRQSNSDIARHLSDYARDPDREYTRELRDSETSFDRAALTFSQLARSDDAKSQSQEINKVYAALRDSATEIIASVDQRQTALVSFQGTEGETADLMQGMISATIHDDSPSSRVKLGILIDMSSSLNEISNSIGSYAYGTDPTIQQRMVKAGEEFSRADSSLQKQALSPLEISWAKHLEGQVEKLLRSGTVFLADSDSLSKTMTQFQSLSNNMESFLAGEVQPKVVMDTLAANEAVSSSITAGWVWLLVLAVMALAAGLAAVLIISRLITGPIHRIMGGAALVASGRIEHRFNTDAGGEFGQLALRLNKMLDNLKRSRDALGESEELAWALLDATHDAVVLTDIRGMILASNEIAAKRFDRSLEQVIDESVYDLLPAESGATLKAHVAELLRSRKPVHYEDEREGKIIEHDIYPVSEHKGEISRIAFFSRDVTMRKWVEDVTEQLARRNTLILESAGEGIFGLDADGKTTFVNRAAAQMHGYKPEELIGKKHHDLVHHSSLDGKLYPSEKCPVHATLKDGTVHSNVDDEVFWRKDGSAFRVEYTSTPIMEDGRIKGAVITFRDIGDRKRVEKALRESEEKYRSVVESAASLIMWLDHVGTIIDCGPRVERFLGYTPDELVGRPFLTLVHEQDRSSVEKALSITAKEGFEHDHHFRMVLKKGGFIEVSMNTAVARDEEGGLGRTICMISAVGQRVSS